MNEALDAERARLKLDLIQARERVRELEAELAALRGSVASEKRELRHYWGQEVDREKARAEKAESNRDWWREQAKNINDEWKRAHVPGWAEKEVTTLLEAKKHLEARVAELEAALANANASASGFAGRYSDAVARAEKAEAELDDWKECAESMQQERDSVKTRVSELEKRIARSVDQLDDEPAPAKEAP